MKSIKNISSNIKVVNHHTATFNQKGFTLIELMVVMVIIGIIAAAVVPQILGSGDKARVKATETKLGTVASALKLYKTENYKYPTTAEGLLALKQQPPGAKNWSEGGYLDGDYVDGWDNELQYISPGTNGKPFDLYSFGADGAPEGEGVDADIEYTP